MKAIAVIGDLHCGSMYGLLPPGFISSDQREVTQNPLQRYLWECWENYWEQVFHYPLAAVVVNGDLVDGTGRKSEGGESCLSRTVDQALAAEMCLEFAFKKLWPVKRYFVAGTDYHVGTVGRDEESIAKSLRGEVYNGEGAGQLVKEVLNLQVDGVTGNFAHHTSFAPVNKTQPIEKELQGSLLAELAGYPNIDYLVRNHVHYYRSVGAGYRHGSTCPCWQLPTKFGRRSGVFKFLPDIGGLVVWVDGDAKKHGDDPVRIQPILYKLPAPKVEVVKI